MTPSRTNPKTINGGLRKLTVKFGSRTTNDVNSDGNRLRQRPPESERRRVELERDKSCSPPEAQAAAASLPAMHDLDEMRENLMYDLRNTVKAHEIFSREEELREEQIPAAAETAAAAFAARGSNIISIRISSTAAAAAAANKIPAVKGSTNRLQIDGRKHGRSSSSPPARDDVVAVNIWERRTRGSSNRKKERARFSLSLTTVEVEEDFVKMIGRWRPERRQKKRSKDLQQRLDDIFPGNGLTEVTADLYKVPGSKANEKE